MAKKYSINQYPKNKDIDASKLNEYQIEIRGSQKKYIYCKEMTCNKCLKKQPIAEFYIKNKSTGRRSLYCRDCQMKSMGVIEIGKLRFADKIEDKGFRRCSNCKTIKPLTEFRKNKGQKNGISNNCYKCSHDRHHRFIMKQKEEIGDHYVKQYCLRNYNHLPKTKEDIEKFRNEIIEKRTAKYHIDNKSFITIRDVARYILKKYGIPETTTIRRLSVGKTLEECKIPKHEMRSKAQSKGKIKVTDLVTQKVLYFNNSSDISIRNMFSTSAITLAIKTGNPTRVTKLSKYKHSCRIERIF